MRMPDVPAFNERIQHIERLVDAIELPIGRWDTANRLTFCNAPYLRWACRPREELLGRTLAELFGESAWAAAQAAFAQAFAGRTVFYERLLTHTPDAPRWARMQVFPDRDAAGKVEAVYTIAFDIHADVVAREALEAARRRLDRFAENIPYPLTYVDRDCVLQFVNKAYSLAAGIPVENLIGRHIGEVRGARRWEEHRPFFERALAGEHGVVYTRVVELRDQKPRWMRTSYVPDRDDGGNVVGAYTVTIDVHELTLARERLQRSIERDALTDVFSRHAMMDRIDAALLDSTRWPVALFFIDLDGFKSINDTFGHRRGDAVLAEVAAALQGAVRGDDAVGRYGGDEFLVLACVRDAAGARTLASHLLQAIAATPGTLPITASIGFALVPGDGTSTAQLIQRADDAMYAAKKRGGSIAEGTEGLAEERAAPRQPG
jgi:diguanylate cyclase (GGDEF)-like protein/PAS domain S-box-containing protein